MMNIFDEAYLIPLLPLLGFLINGLGRKVISKSITAIIGSGVIFLSFCLSIFVFINVSKEGFEPQHINYFSFINIHKLQIPFEFQIDQLTSVFLLIITGVGFLIHLYSTSYMKDEDKAELCKIFFLFKFVCILHAVAGNGR